MTSVFMVWHVLHRRSKDGKHFCQVNIYLAEDTEVVNRSKVPGVGEIHPEVLKALDIVVLSKVMDGQTEADWSKPQLPGGPYMVNTVPQIQEDCFGFCPGFGTVDPPFRDTGGMLGVSPSSLHRPPLLCGLGEGFWLCSPGYLMRSPA